MGRMIDLRSDTVTRPTPGMRQAMASAELGDDVYGDDPSVNRLQAVLAERLGKEAALFMPSGTQSNLCALMAHGGRGDEYLVGQQAHAYKYEAGGAAVLGSLQPQPLPQQADGSLVLADIAAAIKPDDVHFARTRLLALENTFGGRVLVWPYQQAATDLARAHGLGTHLDGARLFNAAVAMAERQGGDAWAHARAIAGLYDTVSVCFSKGLGAPVGSALLGPAELINRARRTRKMLGGGLRQAGVLAAAALYAIDHQVLRLQDDHRLAQQLAAGLMDLPGLSLTPPDTNIVFVQVPPARVAALAAALSAAGVCCTAAEHMRLVTHLDVDAADTAAVVAAFQRAWAGA